jgi:alanyl-tRNA synthetase
MRTAHDIRQTFLDFFHSKGHTIVPSAPIVVQNDPTLMFTNAGMNQFKDLFLGNSRPAHVRVADTQKCLRVSGKHNDLEEVGQDTYHHTMFEMLGNWSFGDYFKKEAIAWAWELLTGVYGIPKDQLYVTVFGGDQADNLPPDEEARRCWLEHVGEDRILSGNKKDNFWEMGDTGPCGPSSEIHVDCRSAAEREKKDGRELVNMGHPEVIEIWYLVFMEFNRLQDASLLPLPARHVDTGMGLERLVRVLQHKTSNYDTDLFMPLIRETERLTGKKYEGGQSNADVAFRVVADHIRAICFAIADGQLPSNTGAGYVIRRILRRAVRYYFSFLDVKEPMLYQLTGTLAREFAGVFPGLQEQQDFVRKVVGEEESGFLRTLATGMSRMEEYFATHGDTRIIDGTTAFELYDTFGFPLDLTRLIGREKGYQVDEAGFTAEMQKQKSRSRRAGTTDTGDWITVREAEETFFTGYDELAAETRVVKYRSVRKGGSRQYQVVLETTPFYAESGGQVGDTGTLTLDGVTLHVTDTKKENNLIIHFTDTVAEDMTGMVVARVDAERRLRTMYNHSATHLLHAALKEVLGAHVNQKGSLVSPDMLRFDVSHFARITPEELRRAESLVNARIRQDIPVVIREMAKTEALQLGAMALFGEKYGDMVRVVTMDPAFSIELCGGTHVASTGMIGLFLITAESAVAAGVRRIEALTGAAALDYANTKIEENQAVSELLKSRDLVKSASRLLEDKSALEKQLAALQTRALADTADRLAAGAVTAGGVSFIGEVLEGGAVESADALKQLCFLLKPRFPAYVFVLAAPVGDKAAVALMLDEETAAAKKLDAAAIIRARVAPLIKGGGGGQKTFATAGGKDASRLGEAVAAVRDLVA